MSEASPSERDVCTKLITPAVERAGWDIQVQVREASAFWKQFEPGIICDGVDVFGTDELTLASIEPYQRFDADWVSFADESPSTPAVIDMRT